MPKRVCVFVDGENLRHSLVDLFRGEFDASDYLPKKAVWDKLFDELSRLAIGADCERVRTYWYVVQHLDFFPYGLSRLRNQPDILRAILSKHEPFRTELEKLSGQALETRMLAMVSELDARQRTMRSRFDGWTAMHNGIATRHRSIEFRPAGAICYNLFERSLGQEKAVDVKLATDLIVLRDIYDAAVIVSGDQDYVPAVQYVKDKGKVVVNVSFKTRGGKLLPGGARRLNQMADWSLCVPYNDMKSLLGL
ncbi:MAG: NYN domain-containing protein [candidate division WOR-3 bacterium]|nr:NYN domain-containing protein [candidate division WOR-3 bacterium]